MRRPPGGFTAIARHKRLRLDDQIQSSGRHRVLCYHVATPVTAEHNTNVMACLDQYHPMLQSVSPGDHYDHAPTVWLVMGHRAGENAQILALGEALGWTFEIKRFVHHWYYFIASLPQRMGLVGIDKRKSSPLQPPPVASSRL